MVAIGATKASSSAECVVERGGRVRVNDQERKREERNNQTEWERTEKRMTFFIKVKEKVQKKKIAQIL